MISTTITQGHLKYTLEVDYLVMGRGIMRGSGMHGKQSSLVLLTELAKRGIGLGDPKRPKFKSIHFLGLEYLKGLSREEG